MKLRLLKLISTVALYSSAAQAETGIVKTEKARIFKSGSFRTMDQDIARSLIKPKLINPKKWDKRGMFNTISTRIIAKGILGMDLGEEEEYLLSDNVYVFSKLGSTFTELPICKRYGDYDFSQADLLKAVYFLRKNQIDFSKKAMNKIVEELLVARGSKPTTKQNLGLCGIHEETENHILMIEISKYLTNQILAERYPENKKYNNNENGMKTWLLDHLAHFPSEYFDEYNSKPYQAFTFQILELLHYAANDKELRDSAKGILDVSSVYTVLQAQNLRRFPPFRRQNHYDGYKESFDGATNDLRTAYLTGDIESYLQLPGEVVGIQKSAAIYAAASSYKLNDVLSEIYWNKDTAYYQRLRHDNTEIYYSSPSYKLSGGGSFDYHFMFFTNEQHGWASPITVLPRKMTKEWSYEDFFHIRGRKFRKHRNNNCVAPNFICGVNIREAKNISDSCKETSGNWTFYDFTKENCSKDYGFYAAKWENNCKDKGCKESNYGFMEFSEATISFEDFKQNALSQSKDYRANKNAIYKTSAGDTIHFEMNPNRIFESPIIALNKNRFQRDMRKWPPAKGDVMNSTKKGYIKVTSPSTKKSFILDYRDHRNPKVN